MSYLDNRNSNILALHYLYSDDVPDYLKDFLEVPEILRLNGIEENSGIDFTGFNIFKYHYSVLDHSLGVALILNKFVDNKNQIIASLFHDINATAYLYSTNYIDKSNFSKDDVELSNYDAVIGSNKLFE